jgi:hypothetical protein
MSPPPHLRAIQLLHPEHCREDGGSEVIKALHSAAHLGSRWHKPRILHGLQVGKPLMSCIMSTCPTWVVPKRLSPFLWVVYLILAGKLVIGGIGASNHTPAVLLFAQPPYKDSLC